MAKVNVYLTFDGNCEDAFNFYKSILGGEFFMISRFGDMPPQEGMPPISDEYKNRVMHVSFPVSKETVLMGSDSIPGMHQVIQGNNFSISVHTDIREEADRIFKGLSEGGTVTMPMSDTFWGAYFGMWTDKYGINWMVNYDDPSKTQPH